jgi:hypothetical protein
MEGAGRITHARDLDNELARNFWSIESACTKG